MKRLFRSKLNVTLLVIVAVAAALVIEELLAQGGWHKVAGPPQTRNANWAISAISDHDIWAVNDTHTPNGGIWHWDGTAWKDVPWPGSGFPSGVAALSPNDVWVVGSTFGSPYDSTSGLIVHWNGTGWTNMELPSDFTDPNGLDNVAALSPTDVWAVGGHTVLHWDGSRWKVSLNSCVHDPLSHQDETRGTVAALSANDVWVANMAVPWSNGVAAHWDGKSWTTFPLPKDILRDRRAGITGFAAVSANDVWAVGPTLLHWDGKAWSELPWNTMNHQGYVDRLYGAAALSAKDVWAVGTHLAGNGGKTLLLHWDGTEWRKVPVPAFSDPDASLRGVAALSHGDVWAIGSTGVVMRGSTPGGLISGLLAAGRSAMAQWDNDDPPTPPSATIEGVVRDWFKDALKVQYKDLVVDSPTVVENHKDATINSLKRVLPWAEVDVHLKMRTGDQRDWEQVVARVQLNDDGGKWVVNSDQIGGTVVGSRDGQALAFADHKEISLGSVVMVSPDEGWAVGYARNPMSDPASASFVITEPSAASSIVNRTVFKIGNSVQYPSEYAVALHYNGGKWELARDESLLDLSSLDNLQRVSPNEGWAIADTVLNDNKTKLVHYKNGKWEVGLRMGDGADSANDLTGLNMVSAGEGWATVNGEVGYDACPATTVLHYTGGKWQESSGRPPTTSALRMPSSAVDLTVKGTPLRYLNGAWRALPTSPFEKGPLNIMVHKTSMVSPDEGWAIGDRNLPEASLPNMHYILHYTGNTWSNDTYELPSDWHLLDIYMVSHSEGWAVGYFDELMNNTEYVGRGLVLHYTGGTWQRRSIPDTDRLNSVYMTSATEGWAVGDSGTLLHYINGSWTVYNR